MPYDFTFVPSSLANDTLLQELADLYSAHYGIWSAKASRNAGKPVQLSPNRLRTWLTNDSKIALAKMDGQVVGYAIAVQKKLKGFGVISWVTQLVIHKEHRKRDVGKTLLFSIWGFSDHFAWGLVTANPYAIRALEKATRRRCTPGRIRRHKRKLKTVGIEQTTYIKETTVVDITPARSCIDTKFFLDHSQLATKLENATSTAPWLMGLIDEGWEWLAFTFHDQPEIVLSSQEIEQMIRASDQVTKQAYSRMRVNGSHRWARHTPEEARLIVEWCGLSGGQSVLDLGCGTGRHLMALASMGLRVTGVDYVQDAFEANRAEAMRLNINGARFVEGDARSFAADELFDAVICLYDVIGSYADQDQNILILRNCARHLKRGGHLLISVMNFEMTQDRAKHFFSLERDPKALSDLRPSTIMETTGNVFDPEFYLIDSDTEIVYRKEQFKEGDQLPAEMVVRDRRYRREEIERLCREEGLDVEWSRFVQTGHWEDDLGSTDPRAKEILVLCTRP